MGLLSKFIVKRNNSTNHVQTCIVGELGNGRTKRVKVHISFILLKEAQQMRTSSTTVSFADVAQSSSPEDNNIK
jgi:hypothetical protein